MDSNSGRLLTLADLLRDRDSLDILRRWGFSRNDLDAGDAKRRLEKIWRGWSSEQRRLFLRTAERIADAENAKKWWDQEDSRRRYKRVSKAGVTAAKLAKEIAILFPPPWEGERSRIGGLVTELVLFLRGALGVTAVDARIAVVVASDMVRRTKRTISKRTGRMHWELLRDLAWLASRKPWLASGSQAFCDERTIRRYVEKHNFQKNPTHSYWKRNWGLIQEAHRLAPDGESDVFRRCIKRYLKSPSHF